MTDDAIHIRDLRVRHGRGTVLAVDDLRVSGGECVGVLGPNGAGKSTLLRTCLGMQRNAVGDIRILGRPLARLGFREMARLRRRIGYVPQLLTVRSETPLTVREVVAIGRTGIAGLFRPLLRDDWQRIDEWIDRLGLAALADRGYGVISGGEQRKTLIARAMVHEPRMLLLDEPTANLDPGWRERIVATIESLHEAASLTVLLVCHELEALPACCRRTVLLEGGTIVADGPPETVLSAARVASLYGPGLGVLHEAGRHALVPARISHA